MTKKLIISGLVIVLGAVALWSFIQPKNEVGTPVSNNFVAEESGKTVTEENTNRYLEYEAGILENMPNVRKVLFFYADWCPTCRPADANFRNETDQIPDDVILYRVNYNDTETSPEEKSLAEKYNVTYQHTFVQLDDQGNVVGKWNGGQIEELLTNLKE